MIMRITSKIGGGAMAMGLAAVLFTVPAFAQQQNGNTGCYSSPNSDTETSKYGGCAPNLNQALTPSAQPQQAAQPEDKAAEDAAKYQGCGSPDLTAKSLAELQKALAASKDKQESDAAWEAAKKGCE